MPDVHHVGTDPIQETGEGVVHGGVSIPIPRPRHVDYVKGDPGVGWVRLSLHCILG